MTPHDPRTGRRRRHSEREIDAMANEGRLTAMAMQLAIDAGADWPSLDGEAQDNWHERAIEILREPVSRRRPR